MKFYDGGGGDEEEHVILRHTVSEHRRWKCPFNGDGSEKEDGVGPIVRNVPLSFVVL